MLDNTYYFQARFRHNGTNSPFQTQWYQFSLNLARSKIYYSFLYGRVGMGQHQFLEFSIRSILDSAYDKTESAPTSVHCSTSEGRHSARSEHPHTMGGLLAWWEFKGSPVDGITSQFHFALTKFLDKYNL